MCEWERECVDNDKAQGTLLVVYKAEYRILHTSVADCGKFRLRYVSSTLNPPRMGADSHLAAASRSVDFLNPPRMGAASHLAAELGSSSSYNGVRFCTRVSFRVRPLGDDTLPGEADTVGLVSFAAKWRKTQGLGFNRFPTPYSCFVKRQNSCDSLTWRSP